ncbi:hypothetical protein NE237_029017 [Protea cynaroides]|uniref:Uncharacterized protein n=1 Tax=Protea cynaroides TaxID=273540 RepID=A0A9Q0GRG8_9MAGN|nr:hypothetical protein NE237_029017 [Protea cynaroides]
MNRARILESVPSSLSFRSVREPLRRIVLPQTDGYLLTMDSYLLPSNNYLLTSDTFILPMDSYLLPGDSYLPQLDGYLLQQTVISLVKAITLLLLAELIQGR